MRKNYFTQNFLCKNVLKWKKGNHDTAYWAIFVWQKFLDGWKICEISNTKLTSTVKFFVDIACLQNNFPCQAQFLQYKFWGMTSLPSVQKASRSVFSLRLCCYDAADLPATVCSEFFPATVRKVAWFFSSSAKTGSERERQQSSIFCAPFTSLSFCMLASSNSSSGRPKEKNLQCLPQYNAIADQKTLHSLPKWQRKFPKVLLSSKYPHPNTSNTAPWLCFVPLALLRGSVLKCGPLS